MTWQSEYKKYNMALFLVLISLTVGFFIGMLISPTLVGLVIFIVSFLCLGLSYVTLQELLISELLIEQILKNSQLRTGYVFGYQLKGKQLVKVESFHGYIENFTLINTRGSVARIYQSYGGHYVIVESFLWLKSICLYEKK